MTKNTHDAPGQMHGYMYQLERALFQLSQTKPGGLVGIETGDDVVVKTSQNENTNTTFEQDKHSTSKKIPFSDFSKDLWNTLLIWLNAVNSGKTKIEHSNFLMVSNKKIPAGRFVLKINKAISADSASECAKELRVLGQAHNGKLKPIIDSVLKYSNEDLQALILRTHVLDGKTVHNRNSFKKDIKDNLGITADLPFHEFYEKLLGWLVATVLDRWENGQEAWLSVDMINQKRNDLIALYHSKPFIEKAVDSLPVRQFQQEAEEGQTFVRQLRHIKLEDEYILDAINDYLRASWEKTRYAEEARVSTKDFDEFEFNLVERWKGVFGSEATSPHKLSAGRRIYFQTTNHRERLMGVETEQFYTTKGAYHRLSNKLKLGWHPEWKELMTQ